MKTYLILILALLIHDTLIADTTTTTDTITFSCGCVETTTKKPSGEETTLHEITCNNPEEIHEQAEATNIVTKMKTTKDDGTVTVETSVITPFGHSSSTYDQTSNTITEHIYESTL